MPPSNFKALSLIVLTVLSVRPVSAQENRPVEPVRIADNVYFVGSSDISSFLITTPAGHILIDGGYETTVPLIEASVAKLGFTMADIRILLNTQAHFDHAAGFARLKQITGAQLMVSERDAPVIEAGGRNDPVLKTPENFFPPAKVDRRLRDGDVVRLGSTVLTARLTAGHTQGCTTWTFDAVDRGRTYKVVVLGGLQILPGTKLTGQPAWPTIETDYERTYEILKRMPVDIFLGAHPAYFDGTKKFERRRAQPDAPNPFVDPDGFRAAVAAGEKAFREQLTRERR